MEELPRLAGGIYRAGRRWWLARRAAGRANAEAHQTRGAGAAEGSRDRRAVINALHLVPNVGLIEAVVRNLRAAT
jgi:hypothetical protein